MYGHSIVFHLDDTECDIRIWETLMWEMGVKQCYCISAHLKEYRNRYVQFKFYETLNDCLWEVHDNYQLVYLTPPLNCTTLNIKTFIHPSKALYILGANHRYNSFQDLPEGLKLSIPTKESLWAISAASMVLYDRLIKESSNAIM